MGTCKDCVFKTLKMLSAMILLCFIFLICPNCTAHADAVTEIAGKIYEFEKDNDFEFSSSSALNAPKAETYGKFYISGNISSSDSKDGAAAYSVDSKGLKFFYTYDDTLLTAGEGELQLTPSKAKTIDGVKLSDKVQNGTILVQTSIDHINWVTALELNNIFEDTPVQKDSVFESNDLQLRNGCYYRVIVAYETKLKIEDKKILFVNVDNYETVRHAEVYEFYAESENKPPEQPSNTLKYSLGSKVRTEKFAGYYGEAELKENDPHYGWDIGDFFVSGYTSNTKDDKGNIVFLKNVGDKLSLWFKLGQNISELNGNPDLSISEDKDGYDQYFETPKMNFGHGALIIRHTNYENVKSNPIIYTDFLAANTSYGADTQVQLFEEGDYEVALDYEIENDKLVDKHSHYRIFFKFSVRNSNCMVYPFDVETGEELVNSSVTKNGFSLDLAKSRYLDIFIKKQVLNSGADGLVEDTRFNSTAKDGDKYTDEGIYEITVKNRYTGQETSKKIYVGSNNIILAHLKTGKTIKEIKALVENGAKIYEDGSIHMPKPTPTPAPTAKPKTRR